VVLAFVAARTKRIRLGIGAFLLPLRNPIEAARQLMSLDVMSGGRLEIAIGMGWIREEFDILGQSWGNRGRRAEEAIEIMRVLWSEQHPHHSGTYYQMPPVTFGPKTIQQPNPPILISGISPIALSRAGRLGDGWYGHDLTVEAARRCVGEIRRIRAEHGRAEEPFEYTSRVGMTYAAGDIEGLAAAGITRVVVDVGTYQTHGRDAVLENLDRAHHELVSVFGEEAHAAG
jgi:probable F420-dependent oxidoreductase